MAETRLVTDEESEHILNTLEYRDGDVYWQKGAGRKTQSRRPAGCIKKRGCRDIIIDGRYHGAHRVAWFLCKGAWPIEEVDHINGNKADNRIENLRCVSGAENQKNAKTRTDNTSGYHNIRINNRTGGDSYTVQIRRTGKPRYLKTVHSLADAIMLRNIKLYEFGFHRNHGRV
jgi:hypothetical protein